MFQSNFSLSSIVASLRAAVLRPQPFRALPDAPCCILGFTRSRRAPQPIRSRLSARTESESHGGKSRQHADFCVQEQVVPPDKCCHGDQRWIRLSCWDPFVQRFTGSEGEKGTGLFSQGGPFTRSSPGIKISLFLSSVRSRTDRELRKITLRPPETPMRRLIKVAVCIPTTRGHQIRHTGPRN